MIRRWLARRRHVRREIDGSRALFGYGNTPHTEADRGALRRALLKAGHSRAEADEIVRRADEGGS